MQKPGPNNNYGIAVPLIPLIPGVISLLSIQLTYFWARYNGHVKPFPHITISTAAEHYPECMIFRAGIIICCFFISATFHIVAWWLDEMNSRNGQYAYVDIKIIRNYGYGCAFLLILSTSTISDGKDMNGTFHVIGATGFFICIYFGLQLITNTLQQIWAVKPRIIPLWSMYYQIGMKGLGGFLLFINFLSLLLPQYFDQNIGNYIEWGATYLILLTFVTIAVDLRYTSIYFALHMCRSKSDQENTIQSTRSPSINNF